MEFKEGDLVYIPDMCSTCGSCEVSGVVIETNEFTSIIMVEQHEIELEIDNFRLKKLHNTL